MLRSAWLVAAFMPATACLGAPAENLSTSPAYEEYVVMVERARRPTLETTIFLPPGAGPFPVAVINHGKAFGATSAQPRQRYEYASAEFVQRGYAVVIPMRSGFGNSGGMRIEGCAIEGLGRSYAEDVHDAIDALRAHPRLAWESFAAIGQSEGGLTVTALGERELPGLKAIVNFAGGLRVTSSGCFWQSNLVSAFRAYGAKARYPALWLYGANDSYFNPELVQQMHAAYNAGGERAQLVAYGPFGKDSHALFSSSTGRSTWVPVVFPFLESVGLPSKVVVALHRAAPLDSGFAPLDKVGEVPYLSKEGRGGYQRFLGEMPPRAFAIGPGGEFGSAWGGFDVDDRALKSCESKSASAACRLYAVDSTVVWKAEQSR